MSAAVGLGLVGPRSLRGCHNGSSASASASQVVRKALRVLSRLLTLDGSIGVVGSRRRLGSVVACVAITSRGVEGTVRGASVARCIVGSFARVEVGRYFAALVTQR